MQGDIESAREVEERHDWEESRNTADHVNSSLENNPTLKSVSVSYEDDGWHCYVGRESKIDPFKRLGRYENDDVLREVEREIVAMLNAIRELRVDYALAKIACESCVPASVVQAVTFDSTRDVAWHRAEALRIVQGFLAGKRAGLREAIETVNAA
jgi:hypothetical protein